MPHLYIAVTAHGYGHLAQVAPIAHALTEGLPSLRITLQGPIEPSFAAARMPPGFRHRLEAADVALPMEGPLHVRWEKGLARYAAFDAEHERHLARQLALLAEDPPDLLLADVPWLPLAAAREMGIPAIALCSLNWLDILVESPIAARVPTALIERMRTAYANAELFLRPRPSMPMAWLPNARDVGPIAMRRPRDPAVICARLGLERVHRLVLIQFGGVGELRLGDAEPLPDGVHLLTPDERTAAGRDDISLIGGPGLTVMDVLPSCDAIVTKAGYGTVAEAACNGIPVLCVPRVDWPEEPHLVDWLKEQVPTRAISAEELAAGHLAEPLEALWAVGPGTPIPATGIEETVALLRPLLR